MQVVVTPKAIKQYRKFPLVERGKIKKKIKLLEEDPLAGKKLEGKYSELRSMRVWPYRIFYYINEKNNKVFITAIFHRQEAYK